MTTRRGMPIPRPFMNVDLHVLPDFTGRVVVHVEDGRHICDRPLNDGDLIATMDVFLALARQAGWVVTPPEVVAETNSAVQTARG
ncbi:hypothetical protein ACSFCX_24025 [Yokenella regensburgei]|uniref:hypothetical protein n=1 Tax=Yokenella regensburgei TaxID=158877 RepID=UPI003EDA1171